mgnify:CR=1 FL=1
MSVGAFSKAGVLDTEEESAILWTAVTPTQGLFVVSFSVQPVVILCCSASFSFLGADSFSLTTTLTLEREITSSELLLLLLLSSNQDL